MNIKKIVRLLLLLLSAVNIILLIMVCSLYKNKYYIDDDYIADAIDIFNADNITITDDAIPSEKLQTYIYSTSGSDNYYEETATALSGDEISLRFRLPDGYTITTVNEDRFEFGSDYYFKYIKSDCPEQIENKQQDESNGNPISSGIRYNKINKAIKLFLLGKGDSPTYNYSFDIENINYHNTANLYTAELYQTIDDVRIYGKQIKIVLNSEYEILYIEGNWCFSFITDRFSAQIYDQVNILFIDKASDTYDTENGINDVHPYYIMYNDGDNGSALIIPSWKITYSSGKSNVYNAENGELYITDIK